MISYVLVGLLVGLVIGAVAAWIIRGLKVGKDVVSLADHQQALETMQAQKQEIAILQNNIGLIRDSKEKAETRIQEKDNEIRELQKSQTAAVSERDAVSKRNSELSNDLSELKSAKEGLATQFAEAERKVAALEEAVKSKEEKLQTQKNDLEEIKHGIEKEFQVIASTVMDNNSRKFNELHEANLKTLLDPLKDRINEFKTEINTRYNDENKERASLRTEIKQVVEMNQRLSKEAENLTNALRGNTKQQGNWGEAILERILEYVGLQKDIHFTVQESGKNEEGTRIIPDVLVKYPDNRVVVVDSKVSLVHYEQYCAATTEESQLACRLQLIQSVKNHINGLSGKKYNDLPGALDSIMMFVPVEAAFITASQGDPNLWQYAYDRGIIMLSPTILLGAMKLIYDYWKRDEVNRNAHEIAKRAGSLYDKFVGFVGSMDDVKKHLSKADSSFSEAYKQLHTGKGSLVSQAAQMQKLHIQSKKQLPAALVEDALLEDSLGTTIEEVEE